MRTEQLGSSSSSCLTASSKDLIRIIHSRRRLLPHNLVKVDGRKRVVELNGWPKPLPITLGGKNQNIVTSSSTRSILKSWRVVEVNGHPYPPSEIFRVLKGEWKKNHHFKVGFSFGDPLPTLFPSGVQKGSKGNSRGTLSKSQVSHQVWHESDYLTEANKALSISRTSFLPHTSPEKQPSLYDDDDTWSSIYLDIVLSNILPPIMLDVVEECIHAVKSSWKEIIQLPKRPMKVYLACLVQEYPVETRTHSQDLEPGIHQIKANTAKPNNKTAKTKLEKSGVDQGGRMESIQLEPVTASGSTTIPILSTVEQTHVSPDTDCIQAHSHDNVTNTCHGSTASITNSEVMIDKEEDTATNRLAVCDEICDKCGRGHNTHLCPLYCSISNWSS